MRDPRETHLSGVFVLSGYDAPMDTMQRSSTTRSDPPASKYDAPENQMPVSKTTGVPSTMLMATEIAAAHFRAKANGIKYRNDPVAWARDRIHQHLWSKQAAIIESLVHNKRTAVKSGHGVGKSHIAAVACQWWIDTHIGEDVMIVTTAPSADQVTGVLWEYIRKSHAMYGLPGTVTEDAKWKDDLRNLVGVGRKPADGNSTAFQGRHYKYTLIIIDEACGISKELFTAIDAIATTDTCRVLAIGNPTDPNTPFGEIFHGFGGGGNDNWNKLTISVLDNPNFTDEECPDEVRAQLSSKQWVADKIAEVGLDTNEYKARVLGEFPDSSEDSLFPVSLLYSAIDNVIVPPEGLRPDLGVDIARYGSDSSAIVSNLGGDISILATWKDADSIESARIIHEHALAVNARTVRVDSVGPGAGVCDQLMVLSAGFDYIVVEMNGAGMTPDPKRWLNSRAYWHLTVRDLLHTKKLSLPSVVGDKNARQLFDEMSSIKFMMNNANQSYQIESKKDMKKRGVKSPDISDALCYACAPFDADDPFAAMGPGDTVSVDAEDMVDEFESMGYVISPS